MEVNSERADRRRRVGLVYDDRMCKHATPDGDTHPENPDRIRTIWKKLEISGITQRFPFVLSLAVRSFYIFFDFSKVSHFMSYFTERRLNMIKMISKC